MKLVPAGWLHQPPTYKIMHLYADRSGGTNQLSVHAVTTATCASELRQILVSIAESTCQEHVDACRVCLYDNEVHFERKQAIATARYRCDALHCARETGVSSQIVPVCRGVLEFDLRA